MDSKVLVIGGKKYRIGKEIGRGSFGYVYKVEDEKQNGYALKIIDKNALKETIEKYGSKEEKKNVYFLIHNELDITGYIDKLINDEKYCDLLIKNNLVALATTTIGVIKKDFKCSQLSNYICDNYLLCYKGYEEEDYIYVLSPLADYDLSKYKEIILDGLPNNEKIEKIFGIVGDLITGLDILRLMNIVHRDIKPENIMMFGDTPRIGDFGLSCVYGKCGKISGTIPFLKPSNVFHFITQKEQKWEYFDDIYSLAILIIDLLSEYYIAQSIVDLRNTLIDETSLTKCKLKYSDKLYDGILVSVFHVFYNTFKPDLDDAYKNLDDQNYNKYLKLVYIVLTILKNGFVSKSLGMEEVKYMFNAPLKTPELEALIDKIVPIDEIIVDTSILNCINVLLGLELKIEL